MISDYQMLIRIKVFLILSMSDLTPSPSPGERGAHSESKKIATLM